MSSSKRNPHRARMVILILGAVLTIGGMAAIAADILTHGFQNVEPINFGWASVILGPLLIGQAILAKKNITTDEAQQLGFDVGYEKGFQQGRRIGKPVVVDLVYPADEVTIRQQPLGHGEQQ